MPADEMELRIGEVLAQPYTQIVVRDPEGTYSAQVLEFPGCFSGGATAEDAVRNLHEAMALWVESELEDGHSIPEPNGATDYSGKVLLRLPISVHRAAALKAELEGTSLNQFLVAAVATYLGGEGRYQTKAAAKAIADEIVSAMRSADVPTFGALRMNAMDAVVALATSAHPVWAMAGTPMTQMNVTEYNTVYNTGLGTHEAITTRSGDNPVSRRGAR